MKKKTAKADIASPVEVRTTKAARKRGDKTADPNNGIRAMLVGLSVLQAIARERRAMPLRDVAAVTGLTPSRVHRYLSSLVAADFVQQDPASGEYKLGEAVIELGLLALGQLDTIRIGAEALTACCEATASDCHLSVWGTFGPTVVRWQSGKQGHRFHIPEGRVLSMLTSATGRVLMAYRDIHEIWPLLESEIALWNKARPDLRMTRRRLETMLKAVRDFGMSSATPDADPSQILEPVFLRMHRLEVETIAVPIFDHQGRAPMAITVFPAEWSSDGEDHERLVENIRHVADSASRRLGAHD